MNAVPIAKKGDVKSITSRFYCFNVFATCDFAKNSYLLFPLKTHTQNKGWTLSQ